MNITEIFTKEILNTLTAQLSLVAPPFLTRTDVWSLAATEELSAAGASACVVCLSPPPPLSSFSRLLLPPPPPSPPHGRRRRWRESIGTLAGYLVTGGCLPSMQLSHRLRPGRPQIRVPAKVGQERN